MYLTRPYSLKNCSLICFLSILLTLSLTQAKGQELEQDSVNLSNPYQTVQTFLYFLQEDRFMPELAARTLNPTEVSQPRAEELAIKLKQVLDGSGTYIDLDLLPRDADHLDSVTNRNRYYLTSKFPDLYVSKVDGNWYFSAGMKRFTLSVSTDSSMCYLLSGLIKF